MFDEINIEVEKQTITRTCYPRTSFPPWFPFRPTISSSIQPLRRWPRPEKRRKVKYIRSRSGKWLRVSQVSVDSTVQTPFSPLLLFTISSLPSLSLSFFLFTAVSRFSSSLSFEHDLKPNLNHVDQLCPFSSSFPSIFLCLSFHLVPRYQVYLSFIQKDIPVLFTG